MDLSVGQLEIRSMAVSSCCTQLASLLPSKVSFPGTSSYETTQSSYWSIQEASLTPSCIVIPSTPQDVSQAVGILSSMPDCHFAIKGHSHMPAAGFANIDAGVTIDMTGLNAVAVNDDQTVVSVGSGGSWLDVYAYLDPLGLSVAGGRNGLVGVGGLTLGGGISYFGPRVGWACDNVVNFETQIVLASGQLTNANASSHPDLFRSLKGGMNNFGVVTRFDLRPFSQGEILAGNIANPISERDAVFKAFSDIAGAKEYDPYASLVTGLSYNSSVKGSWSIATTAAYTKPELNPPVYDELIAIPSTGNTLHLTNLSTLSNETNTPPLNWQFLTGTYGVSATLMSKIFDNLNSTLYDFETPGSWAFWSIAFEPLPTVFTQYGDKNGGNSLGTSPKDGNAFIMLISALWPNSTFDASVEETAEKLTADIACIAEEMGLLHEFQYINYADPSQDPIDGYGPKNVEFLRKVSRRYDPKGVWQKQVPGGFKLGI
ncbi:FAD-binding domain-containing protein [Mollisia scopiformis]|uniref:FAD-binding domain-containing protein n=1 Tax=Mollisia scopiformis TaxID=149040 RepID=A0A194WZU8_MOLSC|nr:FAD-binding domain-containing protein [Mollisia scopiformis]KUJ13466.1 FAD-binding domain-containing protein [Mollisia scopiformis]